MLHNPAYAGTYVYGCRQTRKRTVPGEVPLGTSTVQMRLVARDAWPIVLHDAHPGYISWEHFLRNQQRLDDNRSVGRDERRGAAREGAALLQGIVLCGYCGRRMHVRYVANSTTPRYICNQAQLSHGGHICQLICANGVDAAVTATLLEAMQPAQLAVSLATLDQLEVQARQIDRQWQLRLERAQYEADLARRRFLSVEPENRLVARSLERDWNDKLAAQAALERDYASIPHLSERLVSPEERQHILALAQDVPSLWAAATTTQVERKQLVRFLVKDVRLTQGPTTIKLVIRWQTDACTTLEIARPLL